MTDDATLTDFEAATDETDDERAARETTPDAAETDKPDTDGDSDDSSATESNAGTPLSTYAWGTYACARCGTTTERAWRDEGDYVCPSCKLW